MPTFVMPSPMFSGYGLETGDSTLRTDMESGSARVRRRSRHPDDMLTLKYLFTTEQMAGFRDFWESEWLSGTAWVQIPVSDGRTAGVVSKECRPKPAKFKAEPVSAALWSVSLSVEVRNA